MPRVEVATELDTITCYRTDCGILFAVPVLWLYGKQRDHTDFMCPNGHSQAFLGESKEEKLRKELKAANATVEMFRGSNARLNSRVDVLKRQVSAQRGVATKLRKKLAAGQCPFCDHSFPDVAQHVEAEHPAELAAANAEDESDA